MQTGKYFLRSVLNVAGANLFAGFYATVVWYYLKAEVQNGITERQAINARVIYYSWFVLSVFALDWAHAGTAVIEVAGMTARHLAPQNALQTMWHSERSWSGPTGWMKALATATKIWILHLLNPFANRDRSKPSGFWWCLAIINLPFWLAVPLSGLSFDFGTALVENSQRVVITGIDQTTFETRSPSFLWQRAMERWSQSTSSASETKSSLYSPANDFGKRKVHGEDPLLHFDGTDETEFFSSPSTETKSHGRTWGLKVRAKAKLMPPTNLTMIHATVYSEWKSLPKARTVKRIQLDQTYGCGSNFLVASNATGLPVYSSERANLAASNESLHLPETTLVELIIWQYYKDLPGAIIDSSMNAMMSAPSLCMSHFQMLTIHWPWRIGISTNCRNPANLFSEATGFLWRSNRLLALLISHLSQ
jgi:hypothetical protein